MVSEKEIYVLINPNPYRTNKSNILTTQSDLLNTLKRLQNLKVLARQKNDLKKKILKHIITIQNNIESIQKEIPTTKIPKILQSKKDESEDLIEVNKSFSKRDEIEEELITIQEKLRELNS